MSARATRRHRRTVFLAAALAAAALPGCITGERPTLASGPIMTGDAAVDEVLARLDAAPRLTFTGTYEVLTRVGDLLTPATVAQEGTERRSVTIGQIRFLFEGSSRATCDLSTGDCSDTLDSGRISNTQVTPDFYATSAAAQLRREAQVRTGPTTAVVETIAGQPATCVTVPVDGGELTYCALDSGPLARRDAADVRIDLTAWSASIEESAFSRPD